MDILAHTLWTTAAARKGNMEIEKKNRLSKINMFWIAFFGIFPDLFAFTIPFIISFYKVASGQQNFESFATRHQVADGFNLSHTLYQYSHSLVLWLLIFLIIWLIFKNNFTFGLTKMLVKKILYMKISLLTIQQK